MIKRFSSGHWPVFLFSSVSSVGNLFLPIILVRLLNPNEIGYYKIFFLHLTAIPFLFMSGGPIHSVFFWVGKKEDERQSSLNATWILTLTLSSLILLIGLPMSSQLASYLNMPAKYVIMMLFAGALWCPGGHFTETSIAMGKTIYGSVFDTFFELIKTGGFIYIAWRWQRIDYLFYFYPSLLLIKLFGNIYLNKSLNGISFRAGKIDLKKVLVYCAPLSFAGCLGFFVDKLDLLILSSRLDATNFAFYSMGCLVIPPLYLLEMSVQKVLIPELSKSNVEKKYSEGAKCFRKAVGNIAYLIIPAIFGLVTFGDAIVTLLYTEEYLQSAIYLKLFALSYILLIFPHDSAARATGHTSWILKMYICMMPLSLIVAYFSASLWGAIGVLATSLIIKAIPKFLGLHFSVKIMHWRWSEIFPMKKLFAFTFLSAVLSLTSLGARSFFSNDLKWFLFCSPIFASIYLGTIYLSDKGVKYAKSPA